MLYAFLFIFGLAFGSFLNVVSLRYKPDQKPGNKAGLLRGGLFDLKIIGGRSRCPVCKKQLAWHELVPIFSFLFQKGKCRHCEHLLSLQYPIVEFLTGIIFVAVPVKIFDFSNQIFGIIRSGVQFPISNFQLLAAAVWIVIFLLFILLAIIDFYHYIIPDEINILLVVCGIALIFLSTSTIHHSPSLIGYYSMMFGSFGNIWVNHIIAAVINLIFFGLIIMLSRGRGMGMGDLKLAGALGLILGWPDAVFAVCLAFIVGALASIILMAWKKKKIKDTVPFGPFLVIGSALVFFFGFQIVNLYFGIFGLYF